LFISFKFRIIFGMVICFICCKFNFFIIFFFFFFFCFFFVYLERDVLRRVRRERCRREMSKREVSGEFWDNLTERCIYIIEASHLKVLYVKPNGMNLKKDNLFKIKFWVARNSTFSFGINQMFITFSPRKWLPKWCFLRWIKSCKELIRNKEFHAIKGEIIKTS